MLKRYLVIWFPFFAADRITKNRPALQDTPFVLSATERGRICIKAASPAALREGVRPGMVLADVRAILPQIEVLPDEPQAREETLEALARWSLRFSPIVALDSPGGLILDISGCAHLWGGEQAYLQAIVTRFSQGGYQARGAIADSIGAAWAIAHYGNNLQIAAPKEQLDALQPLPPASLRLDDSLLQRLHKLGFHRIGQFIHIPRSTLRRRFGSLLIERIGQALGNIPEYISPVEELQPYQERLTCMEPIKTATGIHIALEKLLLQLCTRLAQEAKGIRNAVFKGYRLDGDIQHISIGTSRASQNPTHLLRLFELHISSLRPNLGFELFVLEATQVESIRPAQEKLWGAASRPDEIAELIDNIGTKIGMDKIVRYTPAEQHWPERMMHKTNTLEPLSSLHWPKDKVRPLHLLSQPAPIEVMVPLPDYPPMLFRYGKKAYKIVKADGPERIEQEWWNSEGKARDYYVVEDEQGARYWLFRLGQYGEGEPQWFLHGFFA